MKPPLCQICRSGTDHVLIRFKPEYNQKKLRNGMTGHPDNLIWFCKNHAKLTKGLTNFRYSDVQDIIQNRATLIFFQKLFPSVE